MIDKLKILRGKPIEIKEGITLLQPSIGSIEERGEQSFMNYFWTICSSAWDMPAFFDDIGIEFMTVADWSFFTQIVSSAPYEITSLIFKDIDFSKIQAAIKDVDGVQSIVLVNKEVITVDDKDYDVGAFEITEDDYNKFIPYIREMIGFQHKGRKAKNRATAKILIQEDRKERQRNKDKPYESLLVNSIISLVNTEEFNYTYESVFDITIYQLNKSLQQIQGKKNACAILQGSMSGFCDTSKIPSRDMQWVYSEDKYNHHGGKTLKSQLAPDGGSLNVK